MKEKKNKYPRIRVKMQSEEFGDLLGKKESDFHQEHHHKDTFITKNIFSQYHKKNAKQKEMIIFHAECDWANG